jgi:hypothetical protein
LVALLTFNGAVLGESTPRIWRSVQLRRRQNLPVNATTKIQWLWIVKKEKENKIKVQVAKSLPVCGSFELTNLRQK